MRLLTLVLLIMAISNCKPRRPAVSDVKNLGGAVTENEKRIFGIFYTSERNPTGTNVLPINDLDVIYRKCLNATKAEDISITCEPHELQTMNLKKFSDRLNETDKSIWRKSQRWYPGKVYSYLTPNTYKKDESLGLLSDTNGSWVVFSRIPAQRPTYFDDPSNTYLFFVAAMEKEDLSQLAKREECFVPCREGVRCVSCKDRKHSTSGIKCQALGDALAVAGNRCLGDEKQDPCIYDCWDAKVVGEQPEVETFFFPKKVPEEKPCERCTSSGKVCYEVQAFCLFLPHFFTATCTTKDGAIRLATKKVKEKEGCDMIYFRVQTPAG